MRSNPPRPARPTGRRGLAAASVLCILTVLCIAAPLFEALSGLDPDRVDLFSRLEHPSAAHWLGTDELGRDTALRLLHGGRVSLAVGIAGALAAAVLGTLVGLVAGYFGGWVDATLMRFTDGVAAAPLLPLLIVLAAVDLSKAGLPPEWAVSEAASVARIVVIVALFGWPGAARLVRGATLSVRERDYVRAAVGVGAGPLRIMVRHLLPNVASPLLVAGTLAVGHVILLESVLSFLGLGIQPPLPSWGNMLNNAQELMASAPLIAVLPGALIFVTVLAVNRLGDALQETLDPLARPG
ncbi:MAG: ABC transporter permease [Immundisolibacterales bacterium]|nr:ABC transporter permease [Immundisolibacterales bacterium]